MGDNEQDVPILVDNTRDGGIHPLWLRLSAFLEMRSANTRRTYSGILKEWSRFLGAEAGSDQAAYNFIQASDLHAIAYKRWLEKRPGQPSRYEKSVETDEQSLQGHFFQEETRDGTQSGQTNATIHKKFAALRRMYRALIAADLGIEKNPFDVDRVPPPPKQSGQKRPTEMLDYELVNEILELPDVSHARGLRDRAILSVLFGGGLRRSEVVSLRLGDVRKTRKGTVYLMLRVTKSGKDSKQALPAWSANHVLALVKHRKQEGAKSGDYLFMSFRGRSKHTIGKKPLTSSGIYHLFKRYVQQAGGSQYASPHSARATAITRLLDKGLSHRMVKEFSRHSSVEMVEVYDKRRLSVDESPGVDLDF